MDIAFKLRKGDSLIQFATEGSTYVRAYFGEPDEVQSGDAGSPAAAMSALLFDTRDMVLDDWEIVEVNATPKS